MSEKLTRRHFLGITVSAVGAAALAACAAPATPTQEAQPAEATTAAPAADEQKELGFAWWTGGEGANKVFNEAIDRFEEAFPEYTVNRITSPGGEEYHTKLLTMYGAGNAPDCHGLQWGPVWAFADQGVLLDMTPYVDADPEFSVDDMWPAVTTMLYYPPESGKLMALPRETFGLYMRFYNKDLFAAAGVETPDVDYDAGEWTWDVWREKAAQLAQFEGDRRVTMGANQGVGLWDLATVFPSFDLAMVDDDFAHYNLDAPAMMTWLQMVQDMVNEERSIGKEEEQGDFDWGASGKLAIAHDASWAIPNFRETWVDFDWDFVPPPKGVRHANIPGCDFHAVNGQDYADHEGGWKLVSFLNSEAEDLWWAINMYGPPFRKQNVDKWVTEVSAGLPKNGWKYIGDMTAAAAPWPVIPFYEELGVIHGNEISQIPTGERTVEDVVTSIVTQVDAMMAEETGG